MKSNLWHLDMPSEKTKNEYLNTFLDKIRGKIVGSPLENILMPSNDPTILKQLLIGEPKELISLNTTLMDQIKESKPIPDKQIDEEIKRIFNYTYYLGNKKNSYWLAKKIQRNTCVYCNRTYIFSVEALLPDPPDESATSPKEYITRPVFDHWFPKSKYPLLSMSLLNLIPSCSICNSSLKRDDEYNIEDYFHPYIHDEEPQITFRVSKTPESDSEWTIRIDCGERKKEKNTIKAFALNEIYGNHGSLEVKDIMKFNDAYPQGYINTLFDIVLEDSNKKLSRADVYRFFFGTDMDSNHFLDRPLSKMKYDILKELGLI